MDNQQILLHIQHKKLYSISYVGMEKNIKIMYTGLLQLFYTCSKFVFNIVIIYDKFKIEKLFKTLTFSLNITRKQVYYSIAWLFIWKSKIDFFFLYLGCHTVQKFSAAHVCHLKTKVVTPVIIYPWVHPFSTIALERPQSAQNHW